MKDLIRTKLIANKGHDDNEFLGVVENLEFLWEECCNKDKIINILL